MRLLQHTVDRRPEKVHQKLHFNRLATLYFDPLSPSAQKLSFIHPAAPVAIGSPLYGHLLQTGERERA